MDLILAILLSLFVNHAKHVHRFFLVSMFVTGLFFFNATVHTTLPLTSIVLISLAVQFLCVSRFFFCVLSGAVYVYTYMYMCMCMCKCKYMCMCMCKFRDPESGSSKTKVLGLERW